jgi:putative ABC transport system permease protein
LGSSRRSRCDRSNVFIIRTTKHWLRRLRREAALVWFLIVSLGLSLGAAIVALSLNNTVLWRELPFVDPSELITLEVLDENVQPRWLSAAEFRALEQPPLPPFESLAGYTVADFNALSEPGRPPEALLATLVTPSFFTVFGIEPRHGRLPDLETHWSSPERVVLLSHELWQRRYRGAADIVGQHIRLTGPEYFGGTDGDYRVIGVLPADLWLFWKRTDMIIPLQAGEALLRDPANGLIEHVVARLRRDESIETARSVAAVAAGRLNAVRAVSSSQRLNMEPLQAAHFRRLAPQLRVVLAVALIVVLLATVNVVTAAFAQAEAHRTETAIKIAFGAGPWRLFAESGKENAITGGLASLVAVAIGAMATRVVVAQMPSSWLSRIPGGASAFRLEPQVVALSIGALVVIVIFTSAMALFAVRHTRPWALLSSRLAPESRGTSRLRSGLVVAEIALCSCALAIASTLFFQFRSLRTTDLGITADRTIAAWVNLSSSRYGPERSRVAYYDRILQSVASIPSVEAAGAVDLTFQFDWQLTPVRFDEPRSPSLVNALERAATPGYLDASGIRLIAGRWFDDNDRAGGAAVAVISERLASELGAAGQAVGRTLRIGGEEADATTATVVGIVSNTRHVAHEPPDAVLYRPIAQKPPSSLYVIARTRAGSTDIAAALTAAVWRVNQDQPIDGPWLVREWVDNQTVQLEFLALLTGLLAVVGGGLAAAGLYGLTAFWVAQSSYAVAVRRAVGAGDRQIASWFVKRWLAIVLPGLAAGLLMQSAAGQLLVASIEGMAPQTVPHVIAGMFAVVVCATAGAFVPFRRVLRADASCLMR